MIGGMPITITQKIHQHGPFKEYAPMVGTFLRSPIGILYSIMLKNKIMVTISARH